MRAGGSILIILVVALPAPRGVRAQPPRAPEPGERYALLIEVRQYDPNELRSLKDSEGDVVELAGVLRERGYKPANVVLMTQTAGAENTRFLPVAANIRKELGVTLRDLKERDSLLLAFAGHGVQFRGDPESYFCPADARLGDKSTLIPLSAVYKELEASGAGLKLLMVDACRNDPQSQNTRAGSDVKLESVTRPQVARPPGGVVAFFSCSEGERAFEHASLKHGVFFNFVIEGLRGNAVGPGETQVLIPDLEKYVKRRVRDFVRAKYGERQMPELRGSSRDLVPLVSVERPKPRITNSVGMRLALIPAGEFLMGSGSEDRDAREDEMPRHRVRITKPFYLGTTEVTVGQFRKVVETSGYRTDAERDARGGRGWNPAKGVFEQDPRYNWRHTGWEQTDEHPVVNVSWNDAVAFCDELSKREGLTPFYRPGDPALKSQNGYRLPTEAEWEYACRAGTTTRYSHGNSPEGLAVVGNVPDATAKAAGGRPSHWPTIAARDGFAFTAPVGRFLANHFGLSDMHGNVREWCDDGYDAAFYKGSPTDDPRCPRRGFDRVARGGGYGADPLSLRSAHRGKMPRPYRSNFLGFRVARNATGA